VMKVVWKAVSKAALLAVVTVDERDEMLVVLSVDV